MNKMEEILESKGKAGEYEKGWKTCDEKEEYERGKLTGKDKRLICEMLRRYRTDKRQEEKALEEYEKISVQWDEAICLGIDTRVIREDWDRANKQLRKMEFNTNVSAKIIAEKLGAILLGWK